MKEGTAAGMGGVVGTGLNHDCRYADPTGFPPSFTAEAVQLGRSDQRKPWGVNPIRRHLRIEGRCGFVRPSELWFDELGDASERDPTVPKHDRTVDGGESGGARRAGDED